MRVATIVYTNRNEANDLYKTTNLHHIDKVKVVTNGVGGMNTDI
jgi:hypothetical protein